MLPLLRLKSVAAGVARAIVLCWFIGCFCHQNKGTHGSLSFVLLSVFLKKTAFENLMFLIVFLVVFKRAVFGQENK